MEQYVQYLEGLLKQNNIPFESLAQRQLKQRQPNPQQPFTTNLEDKLTYDDVDRYKRQMLLQEIAFDGQVKLKRARVLIVGAGGIGAPASIYLAGAGVGTIGLVDADKVEISNLHRQIIHTTERVGVNKVNCRSAQEQIRQFNPLVEVVCHEYSLTPSNAAETIKQYDIVLDATDNPLARYLINDACVTLGKPLVSGSSVGWEGQLSVYNYQGGPCYRCLFPACPSKVKNCNEAGVFGVLPGVIGLLEALEAVKIIIGQGQTFVQKMLLFDGLRGGFKSVKLRFKQKDCAVCGQDPQITDVSKYDYKAFTASCSTVIPPSTKYENVNWNDLLTRLQGQDKNLLVDCRPIEQIRILNLKELKPLPYNDVSEMEPDTIKSKLVVDENEKIYIMCRRGNQSRLMCDMLYDLGYRNLHNIVGGINQYAQLFDPQMPLLE